MPLLSQASHEEGRSLLEAYRDSNEIKRMKSVTLDRKISTSAKLAQRLTVVESPRGRMAQAGNSDPERLEESIRVVHPNPSNPNHQATSSSGQASPQHIYREINQLYKDSMPQNHHPILSQSPSPLLRDSELPNRPGYERSSTAIRVIEDRMPENYSTLRDSGGLGSEKSPVQNEEGITLADLHSVIAAEQAREQRRSLTAHSQTQLLSELSALEYFIVKHAAAITLASNLAPFYEFAQLDELLDIIDAKKNNFWGKLFKGGNSNKKEVKKKGEL